MSSTTLILASVGLLASIVLGMLAIVIFGIRQGDRGHLANTPKSQPDAIARRFLVGVRYPTDNGKGENQ